MTAISGYRRYVNQSGQGYSRASSYGTPGRPGGAQTPPPPPPRPDNGTEPRQTARSRPNGLAALLPEGLDFSDIFLASMLLFLYSESKDEDFLVILIVVGLSMFGRGE